MPAQATLLTLAGFLYNKLSVLWIVVDAIVNDQVFAPSADVAIIGLIKCKITLESQVQT